MFRSAALPLTDHSSRDSIGRLALGALKAFMSLIEAPARAPERNRNLRVIPTTCARPTAALLSRSRSMGGKRPMTVVVGPGWRDFHHNVRNFTQQAEIIAHIAIVVS
jgi:hypothetical protein